MSPGAACGDPRAAPGYLEASRHARGMPPGGGGKRTGTELRGAWPPQTPKTYKLMAMGYKTYKLVAMGYQRGRRSILCICTCI